MPNDILIRPARFDDIDSICKLEITLFPHPWPRFFFEQDLKDSKTIAYVVIKEDSVVGYAFAKFTAQALHVTNVAVAQPYQRHGIATRLMQTLENEARARECHTAHLEVRTGNMAAIKLYRNLGYSISSISRQYYIDGDDAYVMEKKLE